ncbi:hypothetical protein NA56DRAFT_438952 [Hyaloscypha hepaticicola]|uniref:Uncharacterized protein n=1 Tax=Hyaloscypha hepaticicola TaxID=2082293 RepID=A0A2J6QH21_9HELO|nr:hypothetical protein NA56DRAFT_438952 [Hyaloscypha hepaticicola]
MSPQQPSLKTLGDTDLITSSARSGDTPGDWKPVVIANFLNERSARTTMAWSFGRRKERHSGSKSTGTTAVPSCNRQISECSSLSKSMLSFCGFGG